MRAAWAIRATSLAASVAGGFLVAMAVLAVANELLPAFQAEDDDTLRELLPVAAAYAAWAITALVLCAVAWRRTDHR